MLNLSKKQVRAISDSGIRGNWSRPKVITLSEVRPPTIATFNITRPRHRMVGNDLVVTAVVGASWRPPSNTDEYTITGFEGFVATEGAEGEYGPTPMPSDVRQFQVC